MRSPTPPDKRRAIGQFLTPAGLAKFMASLLRPQTGSVRLLDAGAGKGALSTAAVHHWCSGDDRPAKIHVTAVELDASVGGSLRRKCMDCEAEASAHGVSVEFEILTEDFIASTTGKLLAHRPACVRKLYTAAILNPPYGKLARESLAQSSLRSVGIEVSNTYAAFLALSVKLLRPGGELVAIVPRSFCNGPYFKSFRTNFLADMSLRRLHLIDSRSQAFKADGVLQETMILHAVKTPTKPKHVLVSSSAGTPRINVRATRRRYGDVVSATDPEHFIHLVTDEQQQAVRREVQKLTASLSTLGVEVSTGRVVSFRAKQFLVKGATETAAPLIHPCHLQNGLVYWPRSKGNKANGIRIEKQTERLLVPSGIYVLIKRFTSKEEPKRLVASLFQSEELTASKVGFENHLNFLHVEGRGLEPMLAKALVAFLNSSMIDSYFRQFNGLTQVNAADLRNLPFPSRTQLMKIAGKINGSLPRQEDLDGIVSKAIEI